MDELSKINDFRPPTSMNRREKQLFNRVQKLRKSRNCPLSEAEVPLLIDYVRAVTRLEVMEAAFGDDDRRMRRSPSDAAIKRRLVATARQIDSSTKLAREMRERLICMPCEGEVS